MRAPGSLPAAYFDGLYAGAADPWGFAWRWYEQAKYRATLAALSRRRYRRALEVGCSIGVLTERLAGRCDQLVAVDVSEAALAQARLRLADQRHVELLRASLPDAAPAGPFDLFLLSEVVYYLDEPAIGRLGRVLRRDLAAGGQIVAVHWTRPTSYPLTGDAAMAALLTATQPFIRRLRGWRTGDYRLDVMERR